MKKLAVCAVTAGSAGLFYFQAAAIANPASPSAYTSTTGTANSTAPASSSPDAAPAELRELLPLATLTGRAKLTFLGLSIYNASLWVAPGFKSAAYEKHGFALELAYLRNFSGEAIAKRSISEMRRQFSISESDEARWEKAMREAFPDVKPGDRITGVNRPGAGAAFLVNGKLRGEIRDPEFARLFFGIWLSGASLEPKMRADLLSLAQP